MRTGLTISTAGHLALLAWALIAFVAKPLDSKPAEALPIDIITPEQFSKIAAGQKDAKKVEEPKRIVEKIAEPKPVEDTKAKISEKKEVQPAIAEPPPAPEEKPEKQQKKAEPKVDQIAEALKKEAATQPPKKPAPPQPKFDARKVAALLDKRLPQRQAAAGDAMSKVASVGLAEATTAAKLSQSELDALRARLAQLWNPPVGIRKPEELVIRIRVRMNRDGMLAGPPMVMTSGQGTEFDSARDSAVRALFRGQPFNMLRQETYDVWQDMEITFDPRDMFRG